MLCSVAATVDALRALTAGEYCICYYASRGVRQETIKRKYEKMY